MIVRTIERPSAHLLTRPVQCPEKMHGTVGAVDVLQLTSTELRDTFGISLCEMDCETPFELAAALAKYQGRATAAPIRNDRLVRLLDRRPTLLPCFVGYQEHPGSGLLPFMTDGVPGRWSLFFEADGRMTLAEMRGDGIALLTEGDLLEPVAAARAAEATRSWLFGGRVPARVIGRRSEATA